MTSQEMGWIGTSGREALARAEEMRFLVSSAPEVLMSRRARPRQPASAKARETARPMPGVVSGD